MIHSFIEAMATKAGGDFEARLESSPRSRG